MSVPGVAPDAIPRVALIGRLSLFGAGGARLHDELIEITARWVDPADRKPSLRPYGEDATQRTLELLDETLAKAPKAVADTVIKRISAALRRDVEELTPHLESRAETARKAAEKALTERGEREAQAMRDLLADQEKRIRETIAKQDLAQLSLDLGDIDRRQAEADRKYRKGRLDRLAEDREREPRRIVDGYLTRAARLEPVGIVYLWPATG